MMASARTSSPPNSLQLVRFGHGRGGSSPVILGARFRPPGHRIRLLLSSGASEKNGSKFQSWFTSNGQPDPFAGWTGPEIHGGDSEKKGGLGGILGAGLAGVFFAAGVAFAAVSLSSRSASGPKQHLEQLTSEQKVISSDDTAENNHVRSEDNRAHLNNFSTINDCYIENGAGTSKDCSPVGIYKDSVENTSDSRQRDSSSSQITKPSGNDVSAIWDTERQDDEPIDPDVNDISRSDASPTSALSENVTSIPSDMPHMMDSHSYSSPGILDPIHAHEANLVTVTHLGLSASCSNSENSMNDQQQVNLGQAETTIPEIPLNSSSGTGSQFAVETLSYNVVVLESGDVVETQDGLINDVDSAAYLSQDQGTGTEDAYPNPVLFDKNETSPLGAVSTSDFEQSKEVKLRDDSINSSLKGHKLSGSMPNKALPELDKNENKAFNDHGQFHKSQLFEFLESEKSLSHAGIPAPSLPSAALQASPGKVLVPAVVDQAQGQAFAALQVLKVIEADAQPGDLCTRREYARWLVAASSLSRNTVLKVYPAMYIENVTELAFDDVTPEDPDFTCIQGLAEAGLIFSKLSRSDTDRSISGQQDKVLFSPESPLSRQDLVSWKMALEKRQLPEVDKNSLYQRSGYIDIDRIDPEAWPALVADAAAGDQSITALAFGYTRLFQPNKPVTKAQAAIALTTGDAAEVINEELARIEAETLAESAVNAHTALVAQVEEDLNASFEKELAKEREKIEALEKLAQEARLELEKLRAERAEENNTLTRGRAAVESEIEVLSNLRHEMEEQLQSLVSSKVQINFERDRLEKLRKEADDENQIILQLKYELEVERKALSMARAWAEEEAERAREQARALEEARAQWAQQGIKVVVNEDLQDESAAGITWVATRNEPPVDETVGRATNLSEKLKEMAAEMKVRSSAVIEKIIEKIASIVSKLKQQAAEASQYCTDRCTSTFPGARTSVDEFRGTVSTLGITIGDKAKRVVEDCKEGVEKITQKFKT